MAKHFVFVHEAGHAVVAEALGAQVREVYIDPVQDEAYTGTYWPDEPAEHQWCLVNAAGAAAELIVLGCYGCGLAGDLEPFNGNREHFDEFVKLAALLLEQQRPRLDHWVAELQEFFVEQAG